MKKAGVKYTVTCGVANPETFTIESGQLDGRNLPTIELKTEITIDLLTKTQSSDWTCGYAKSGTNTIFTIDGSERNWLKLPIKSLVVSPKKIKVTVEKLSTYPTYLAYGSQYGQWTANLVPNGEMPLGEKEIDISMIDFEANPYIALATGAGQLTVSKFLIIG